MILDFNNIEAVKKEHLKDGDGYVMNKREDVEGLGGIIINCIPPGSSIGIHQHTEDYEVCYVISGKAYEKYPDGFKALLEPGMVTYCPTGESHGLFNEFDEDFVFFGILPLNK